MKKGFLSLLVVVTMGFSFTAMAQDNVKKEASCDKTKKEASCCKKESKSCCSTDKKTANTESKTCCSAKKENTAETKSAGKK